MDLSRARARIERHGYRLRPAVAADLEHLPHIERAAAELFRDVGLAERFARILTPHDDLVRGLEAGRLWVATRAAGRALGFALAGAVGGNAHLDELDVHPEHVRRGLGTALVGEVVRWARASGYPALTLTTLRHVPWNAPFYERLGFRILEDAVLSGALRELLAREVALGLPAEGRVAMRLSLAPTGGAAPTTGD